MSKKVVEEFVRAVKKADLGDGGAEQQISENIAGVIQQAEQVSRELALMLRQVTSTMGQLRYIGDQAVAATVARRLKALGASLSKSNAELRGVKAEAADALSWLGIA